MIILDEYRPLKMIFDQDKYIFDIRFIKKKLKLLVTTLYKMRQIAEEKYHLHIKIHQISYKKQYYLLLSRSVY